MWELQLGSVEHVVAPNYEHVKYTAQWAAAYPDANVYGAQALEHTSSTRDRSFFPCRLPRPCALVPFCLSVPLSVCV